MQIKVFKDSDLEKAVLDSNIFVLSLMKGQYVNTQVNPVLEGVVKTEESEDSVARHVKTEVMRNNYSYVVMVYYLEETEIVKPVETGRHLSS